MPNNEEKQLEALILISSRAHCSLANESGLPCPRCRAEIKTAMRTYLEIEGVRVLPKLDHSIESFEVPFVDNALILQD